ncbi:MAG: LysR substrate-binding domain-containing protein [Chania sp.]
MARNSRQVSLTRAGEVFLQQAINILELSKQAKQLARKAMEEQVRLTIGFVPCAEVNILPEGLPKLRQQLPAAGIELVSIITTQQEEKLLKGEIDVGFMRRPIISNQLNYRVVYREPLMVVMHVNHPLSKETQLSPQHLDGENFISTDPAHSGALYQMVETYLAASPQQAQYRAGRHQYSGHHESGGDGARNFHCAALCLPFSVGERGVPAVTGQYPADRVTDGLAQRK